MPFDIFQMNFGLISSNSFPLINLENIGDKKQIDKAKIESIKINKTKLVLSIGCVNENST